MPSSFDVDIDPPTGFVTADNAFSSLTAGLSFFGFGSIAANPLNAPPPPPPPPSVSFGFFRTGSSVSPVLLALALEEEAEGGGRSRRILTGPLAFFVGWTGAGREREELLLLVVVVVGGGTRGVGAGSPASSLSLSG